MRGPIKYTQEERDEWEAKMQERADRLEIEFKALDYPLTNLIATPAE